ncbi:MULTISPECIES: hypothetical protein [Micrococcaceae]|jgi:hypothetical protein|uniref:hypothetical protein n=1 Tax=Micrococcaceae TaxID=1268 RepID=UPI001607A9D0|nr:MULTISPECIES: hypothetical protein [Micrococcaceae]MBB5749518.1 hypothetical protein [Micrococcus sp. TA1]HRO30691.1 hypothetical protein [Citricoccus sp.]HRO94208.1 hypothetical protein [Citricoccus sp.]
MSSTPRTPPTSASSVPALRSAHARSLTRRMLSGEGAVELTAYRAGETLSSAVHGVSRTGQLVVADIPNLFHSLGAFHTPEDIEVRVDIVKDAADHGLNLRLASVHLLGTLRWCRDTAQVEALGLQGRVADLVHDVGPRVRVGVVTTERVLLHDCSGVNAHGEAVLVEASAAPSPADALADAVLATAPQLLANVADAVLDGEIAGWAEPLDVPATEDLTVDPVHCVDVDHHCVSLARFAGDQGWVVQVPLPSPSEASPLQDSSRAWHHLLGSLPARLTADLAS